MDFGQKIKKICELEDIKLKRFSELCKISYNSIAAYSSGKRTPSWENINQIANTPEFSRYKQFLLSPDSNDPELGAKIDAATLNEKESALIEAFRKAQKEDTEQAKKLKAYADQFMKIQYDLDS